MEKVQCDGVGGLCKHYATKFNLQKEPALAIRNAASFVDTVGNILQNITILLLKIESVQTFRSSKEKEWANVKPVIGIRTQHYWLVQKNEAYMGRTVEHNVQKVQVLMQLKRHAFSVSDFSIGEFVGCIYEDNWWIGCITSISQELDDITVSFMHPHGPAKGFQWPEECGKKKMNVQCQ